MLQSGTWPTGVSLEPLPPDRTVTDAAAAGSSHDHVAAEGTAECDAYCNMPLRCTRDDGDFPRPR